VTPSSNYFSGGTDTSGVKKKYKVLPSGVIYGESSAPAVLIGPSIGIGSCHSLECSTGGKGSRSVVIFTEVAGMASLLDGIIVAAGVGPDGSVHPSVSNRLMAGSVQQVE